MRWLRNKDPDAWQDRINELESQKKTTLLFEDSGGYYIRPGSVPYLKLDIPVENLVEYPEFKPYKWQNSLDLTPYLYQVGSVNSLLNEKHGNIELSTGSGKSLILLMLAQLMGLRTVVATPSRSIFMELLEKFEYHFGSFMVGGFGDGKKDIKKPITIAIGKSLTMLKEGSPEYKFFADKQAMLIDESHQFGSETLEKTCHGALANIPYRALVSATQSRGDGGEILLYSIIGKTVWTLSIQDAIAQGYLCPLKFKVITTFSPSTKKKTDPIECKREHFLHNTNIIEIAAKIANASWELKKESTLILVEELSQIQMVSELLRVPYGYVHSSSKAEAALYGLDKVSLQEQVDRFNRGDSKILIGTKAIATGTNIYPTHNTINLMGGSSEVVTKQGPMGRSTRKLEISKYASFHKPKPFTMIYDFRVTGQPILEQQLKKRIEYYEETGETVQFY